MTTHIADLTAGDTAGAYGTSPERSEEETGALADRVFASVLGALDVLTIHIGDQLGLYDLLHRRGPLGVADVADATGVHPRYTREWLEQQAVAGIIEVLDPTVPADQRRYWLSEAHAAVLSDRDSLAYATPFARMVAAAAAQLPQLLDAYRTGDGVSWEEYGELMRTAQAEANRPLFLQVLGSDWLPSVPGVDAELRDGGRVADIGCGEGWSSIGIARAYPAVTVDGYDVDADSVEAARRHAEAEGLGDRVRFTLVDASSVPASGEYDLVTAFECIHDLPDPVGVLRSAHRMVKPGGTVLVMDERVPETFTGPGDAVEQLMYGISMLVCLPDGLSHSGSVGTGTVMRPDTLRGYARDAGFDDIEILPIEHDIFRFYRLLG
jgi:2-polyprenyl-3-methyl-5-hydroxy-6-metoxy-1,4-benzoquinol methylase